MIEKITVEELKQMQEKEGIVFQGCGGELQEWEDGVNELLTESGILLDGDTFKNVYAFENEGLTNLFFDMEGVKLNMGCLLYTSTFLMKATVYGMNCREIIISLV